LQAGALLILGTLLCRNLTELQDSYTLYAESFREGLGVLRELAQGLGAARRVLLDLRDIIEVVEKLISQPFAPTEASIPIDMSETLIPYTDFAQQAVSGSHHDAYPMDSGQNWFTGGTWVEFDPSQNPYQMTNLGYGAPWI
jgi:hypothetical protein